MGNHLMGRDRIPNIFHFIYFSGGRDFHLVNHLSIKSAYLVNQPQKIYFYCDQPPSGEWWGKTKPYVQVVTYPLVKDIFGVPVKHPAHQADVARLKILLENGGIYLDTDVICHRPFSPFLNYPTVLGEEKIQDKTIGICSAVIMAEKNALFLQRWLEGFDPARSLWRGFRSTGFDLYYAEMTTRYAKFLSTIYPEEVHLADHYQFFYPTYEAQDLYRFYETNEEMNLDKVYSYHLWGNSAWERYLSKITPEDLKGRETNFSRIVRPFLD